MKDDEKATILLVRADGKGSPEMKCSIIMEGGVAILKWSQCQLPLLINDAEGLTFESKECGHQVNFKNKCHEGWTYSKRRVTHGCPEDKTSGKVLFGGDFLFSLFRETQLIAFGAT